MKQDNQNLPHENIQNTEIIIVYSILFIVYIYIL